MIDIIIRTKHMLQAWIGYNAIVHVFLLEGNTRKHHDEEDGTDGRTEPPPPSSSSSSSVSSETSRIAKLKQKRKTNKNSTNTKHKRRNKHVKPRTTAKVSGVLWSIDEMSGETFTMSKTRQGFQQGNKKKNSLACLCVGGL